MDISRYFSILFVGVFFPNEEMTHGEIFCLYKRRGRVVFGAEFCFCLGCYRCDDAIFD